MPERREPIIKKATNSPQNPEHGAAIIFVHGFSDDAAGCENIPDQFQAAGKLPYMTWVLPNAMENRDVMDTAWYTPTALSPFPPQRPELEDDEDEDGMLASLRYLEGLIDELHTGQHIPLNRIVLAGFSQGCAMSLLLGLTSARYADRLAGLAGLMGYLPLGPKRVQELRAENGLPASIGHMPILLVKGETDRLVPRRIWNLTLAGLQELKVAEASLEPREYEGLGHQLNALVLRDLCIWLEKHVPNLEA